MGSVCAYPDCGPCAETCHGVDVDEAPSRVSGAIGRSLTDAAAGYRAHLAGLLSPAVDGGTAQ